MTRALYDPLIPPEREITARLHAQVEAQRGTNACTRGPGEQYIITCQCGALEVTSDTAAPGRFDRDHQACHTVAAAALA